MKKNCFARFAAAALSLAMLAGCGASQSSDSAAVDTGSADSAELTVFAAASMTETLNRIAEDYKAVAPNVTLTFNFASSGDLLTQIKEGADCDVFISAAPKQMNALDGSLKDDTDKNPDGLDELLDGIRIDLLDAITESIRLFDNQDLCSRTRSRWPYRRATRRVCRALMTSRTS